MNIETRRTNMRKNKSETGEKSGFDTDKDHEIAHVGEVEEGDSTIHVSVRSYDGGDPKVSVTRTFTKKDGTERFGKLGRIEPATAAVLGPMLVAAAKVAKNAE
jgi:hypothetical protein